MKLYKEWLCDDNNKIIKKTLREWIEDLQIEPEYVDGWLHKTRLGKYISIRLDGGYGMYWEDRENHMDKIFYVGNADLNIMSLCEDYGH